MKVISLFDGISCGQVALNRAGIKVDQYVAFEIELPPSRSLKPTSLTLSKAAT